MRLRRGDRSDAVKTLQRDLNKLGSLLPLDGDFADETEAAVVDARARLELPPSVEADDELGTRLASSPDSCPALSAAGATMIAWEEIGSSTRYRQRHTRPSWPSAGSGITIGIGYDLRFASPAKLRADWGGVLKAEALERLAEVCGSGGSQPWLAALRDVEIPLLDAVSVFLERMLPEHVAATRRIYPSLDALPPARRTALVSLVFNRGTALEGAGDRRREMKRIQELLADQRLDEIAEQFESMKRLWAGSLPGLVARRDHEASLWRSGFAALDLE